MMLHDIWKQIHSQLQFENLIPVLLLNQEQQSTLGLDPTLLQETANLLEVHVNDLYYESGHFLTPFCYYRDWFYFGFQNLHPSEMRKKDFGHLFRQQYKKAKELIDVKNYDYLFQLLDKRIRLQSYKHLLHGIPDDQKYEIFVDIYTGMEDGFSSLDLQFMHEVFSYRRLSENYMPFEKRKPDSIDPTGYVTIYRGQNGRNTPLEVAYSWTIEPKIAIYFANRFRNEEEQWKAKVHVDHIQDYYPMRKEEEVIVFPEHVKELERYEFERL